MVQTRKVLIVDDDNLMRKEISRELKRQYCNTFQAANGKSAMDIIKHEDIEVVILDVKLPDIDGLELTSAIKEMKPDCEIIVITGLGTQEIAIQALRRGAIDYLEKPVNANELTAALGRAQEKLAQKKELCYKNTLLVIDDEEEAIKSLSKYLKKEGYEVFTALSGEEGLRVIGQYKIDVFIIDFKMGDMSGVDVLTSAKKLHKDIEGIMVTGYKDSEVAVQALRAGAIDCISKPINLDELLLSVQKAIEIISLNRNRLYRDRELKISSEIISKMNIELERRIEQRSKELNQTQAQLFQTSKLAILGEMSTGLAHEMNQPLSGISLVSTSLRKMSDKNKLTTEELNEGLDDIDKSVKRMSKVIQHIRTFARQEALKFEEVDICETIDSAMNLLGEQLRLHEVEVVLKYDEDIPPINGEPYQLEQVWINFISNARDAMREKEEKISKGQLQADHYRKKLVIAVTYDRSSNYVKASFEDNGTGMPSKNMEKALEPFFTTKEIGKGSGLGLSISYGIIQSHNGKIKIESTEGRWMKLTATFPIVTKRNERKKGARSAS